MALRNLEDQFSRFHIENESGSGVESPVDEFHGGESNSEADKTGDSSDGLLLSSIACPVDKFHEEDSKSESDNSENGTGGPLSSYVESHVDKFQGGESNSEADKSGDSSDETLLSNYKTFEQHPDFSKFVDMESLTLGDLPEIYQHNEMLDLIRAEASVVVKIHMGDNIPGSGLADDVWFSYDEGFCPCSCDSCVASQDKEWGIITIVTSSKLMYGSTENIPHLTCTFFYDSEDRKEVKQLQAHKLQSYNERSDMMMFSCLTSDMVFLNKVMANLHTFSDCWKTAFDKYYSTVKWEQEKIAFVVSHPYGLRKHLAIGHQLSSQDDDEVEKPKIAYDIPSCPGCIGAYVLLPYFDVEDDWFNII